MESSSGVLTCPQKLLPAYHSLPLWNSVTVFARTHLTGGVQGRYRMQLIQWWTDEGILRSLAKRATDNAKFSM